ncbi:MAG: UvrD-helicase domain-containing protein [Chlamydiales bacterium]
MLKKKDFLNTLNPHQIQAVNHIEGPLLVLAGAGSGKTRVVIYRIAHLIQSGILSSEILAVTFTNKAASEMRERIYKFFPQFDPPLISTFHSLGTKILRESIHHLGYSQNFIIYDEEDVNKILKRCLKSSEISKETKTFRGLISHAKNTLQDPLDIDLSIYPDQIQKHFHNVYSLYQTHLKESNALDFDDLLYLTVYLLQNFPNILADYQQKWSHLLIDEYQDTNHAQYMIARLIVGEKCNIFVVGDPDQSIYSWRGANIENILNFERDYPGAKVICLEQNYRSTTNILDAANALIRHNNSRYEKRLWSPLGEGEKIALFIGSTEREEAEFVVNEIHHLHTLHQIPLNQIAIFYRTNFQSRLFEDFLLRQRTPYTIVGGISFYQRKEIKDLLTFLRMLISNQDLVSFERTINLPKRGFGSATIEKIHQGSVEQALPLFTYCVKLIQGEIENIRLSTKQLKSLNEYVSIILNLRHIKGTISLKQLVMETILQTHYLDFLQADKETFQDRKENTNELIAKAHEWELMNNSNDLDNFLEELSLKGSIDEADILQDKVNLMTLHNGKGLEFTVVFLVGMEEDLFPHINSSHSFETLEEERRLCYVGLTRAKSRLYLTATETRFLWGRHRMMRPSRFLKEIPKKYLERFH